MSDPASVATTVENKVAYTRGAVDAALAGARDLYDCLSMITTRPEQCRRAALVVTKLEEAELWLTKLG